MTQRQPDIVDYTHALRAALAPAVARGVEVFRQVHTALQPLIEHAEQHPEVWDQWRRQREAEAQHGSCHCLCGLHREQAEGVCTGVAEPGASVRFNSPTVGPTDVPMCRPCSEANAARARWPEPQWLRVEDIDRAEVEQRRADQAHLDAVREAFPPPDGKQP
jgi:hypothetical protein